MSLAVASAPASSSQLAISPAPTSTAADGSNTLAGLVGVGAGFDSEGSLVVHDTANTNTQKTADVLVSRVTVPKYNVHPTN